MALRLRWWLMILMLSTYAGTSSAGYTRSTGKRQGPKAGTVIRVSVSPFSKSKTGSKIKSSFQSPHWTKTNWNKNRTLSVKQASPTWSTSSFPDNDQSAISDWLNTSPFETTSKGRNGQTGQGYSKMISPVGDFDSGYGRNFRIGSDLDMGQVGKTQNGYPSGETASWKTESKSPMGFNLLTESSPSNYGKSKPSLGAKSFSTMPRSYSSKTPSSFNYQNPWKSDMSSRYESLYTPKSYPTKSFNRYPRQEASVPSNLDNFQTGFNPMNSLYDRQYRPSSYSNNNGAPAYVYPATIRNPYYGSVSTQERHPTAYSQLQNNDRYHQGQRRYYDQHVPQGRSAFGGGHSQAGVPAPASYYGQPQQQPAAQVYHNQGRGYPQQGVVNLYNMRTQLPGQAYPGINQHVTPTNPPDQIPDQGAYFDEEAFKQYLDTFKDTSSEEDSDEKSKNYSIESREAKEGKYSRSESDEDSRDSSRDDSDESKESGSEEASRSRESREKPASKDHSSRERTSRSKSRSSAQRNRRKSSRRRTGKPESRNWSEEASSSYEDDSPRSDEKETDLFQGDASSSEETSDRGLSNTEGEYLERYDNSRKEKSSESQYHPQIQSLGVSPAQSQAMLSDILGQLLQYSAAKNGRFNLPSAPPTFQRTDQLEPTQSSPVKQYSETKGTYDGFVNGPSSDRKYFDGKLRTMENSAENEIQELGAFEKGNKDSYYRAD